MTNILIMLDAKNWCDYQWLSKVFKQDNNGGKYPMVKWKMRLIYALTYEIHTANLHLFMFISTRIQLIMYCQKTVTIWTVIWTSNIRI